MNIQTLKNKFSNNKDLIYLISGGKIKLCKSIIVLLLNFFLTWFLANFCSKELFGNYEYFLSILGLVSIFAFPGIKEAITQSVARGYDTSFIFGTKIAIKFSFIGSGLLLLISGYYFYIKEDFSLFIIFLISAFFFPFFYTIDNFFAYLNGKEDYRRDFLYQVIINLIKILVIIFCVTIFTKSLFILIIAFFISQVIPYFYFYFKCKKETKSKKTDSELYSYGWFLTKMNAVTVVTDNLDKFIVGSFLGPTVLALYYIGIMLPAKVKMVIKPALYVLFPRFSNNRMGLTKNKIFGVFFFSIITFLFTVIIISYFIKIIFPGYTDSVNYGRLYSLIIIFLPLNIIFEYFFKAKKKLIIVKNALLIPKTINIILSIPILYFFGVYGLILLLLLEQFITLLINIKYYVSYNKENSIV